MTTRHKSSKLLEEYFYNKEAIARYRQAMTQLEEDEQNRPPARAPPGAHRQQYIHTEEEMSSAMPLHKRDTDDMRLQAAATENQRTMQAAAADGEGWNARADAATTPPGAVSMTNAGAHSNALLSQYYTGGDGNGGEVEGIIGNTKRPAGLYQSLGPKIKVQQQHSNAIAPPSRPAPQGPAPGNDGAAMLGRYAEMRRSREQLHEQQQQREDMARAAAAQDAQAWEGFFHYAAPHPAATPSSQNARGDNAKPSDWSDLREGIDHFRQGRGYADMRNGREQLSERRPKPDSASSPDGTDGSSRAMSRHEKARFAKDLLEMEQGNELGSTQEFTDGRDGDDRVAHDTGDGHAHRGEQQHTLYQEFSRGRSGGAPSGHSEGENDDDDDGGYAASLYHKGRQFQDTVRKHTMELKDQIETTKMVECRFVPRINPFSRAIHTTRQAAYPAVSERDRNNCSAVLRRNSNLAHYSMSVWRERGGDESTEEFVDQHHSFHKKHGLEFSTAEAREKILHLQQEEQQHALENDNNDNDDDIAAQDADARASRQQGSSATPARSPGAAVALERYRDRGELGAENIGHYLYNLRKQKEYHHELLKKDRDQELDYECTFRPNTVKSPWVKQVTPRYLNNGNNASHNASAVIAGPLYSSVDGSKNMDSGPNHLHAGVSHDYSPHHDSHCHYTGAEECTFQPVINSPKRHRATTPIRTTPRSTQPSSAERRKQLPWLQKATGAETGSTDEYEHEQEAVFDAYLNTPVHERLHWGRKLTSTHDAFHQHHHHKMELHELPLHSRYNAQRLNEEDMHKFQMRMADAERKKKEKLEHIAEQVTKKELPFKPKLSAASRSYTPKKSLHERNEEMLRRRKERVQRSAAADSGTDTAAESGKEDIDDGTFKPRITAKARHRKPHTIKELMDGKREDRERRLKRLKEEEEQKEMEGATFAPHVEYNDEYKNRGKISNAVKSKDAYEKFLEGEHLKKEQLARRYMKERMAGGTNEEAECTFKPEIHPAPNYARAINATLQAAGENCHENAHRRGTSQDSARPTWKHI